jgi:hypothetical protein
MLVRRNIDAAVTQIVGVQIMGVQQGSRRTQRAAA